MKNKKDILVTGAYGEYNFGDDALMSTIDIFFSEELPQSSVYYASGHYNKYANKHLIHGRYLNQFDLKNLTPKLLVLGGGTQFFSFNSNKKQGIRGRLFETLKVLFSNPGYIWNKIFLKSNLKKRDLEMKQNITKLATLGIGLGPFSNEKSKSISLNKIKDASFLSVRDLVSFEYSKELSRENIVLGSDICFSSYFDRCLAKIKTIDKKRSSKYSIGIIVRDWTKDSVPNEYLFQIFELLKDNAIKENYEFHFIAFSEFRDAKLISLLNERNFECNIWNPSRNSIIDYLDYLNTFDSFITARYHGGVFASLLSKPTIAVEIEPKLKILSDTIPEMLLWKKPYKLSDLKNQVLKLKTIDCSNNIEAINLERIKSDNMLLKFADFVNAEIY